MDADLPDIQPVPDHKPGVRIPVSDIYDKQGNPIPGAEWAKHYQESIGNVNPQLIQTTLGYMRVQGSGGEVTPELERIDDILTSVGTMIKEGIPGLEGFNEIVTKHNLDGPGDIYAILAATQFTYTLGEDVDLAYVQDALSSIRIYPDDESFQSVCGEFAVACAWEMVHYPASLSAGAIPHESVHNMDEQVEDEGVTEAYVIDRDTVFEIPGTHLDMYSSTQGLDLVLVFQDGEGDLTLVDLEGSMEMIAELLSMPFKEAYLGIPSDFFTSSYLADYPELVPMQVIGTALQEDAELRVRYSNALLSKDASQMITLTGEILATEGVDTIAHSEGNFEATQLESSGLLDELEGNESYRLGLEFWAKAGTHPRFSFAQRHGEPMDRAVISRVTEAEIHFEQVPVTMKSLEQMDAETVERIQELNEELYTEFEEVFVILYIEEKQLNGAGDDPEKIAEVEAEWGMDMEEIRGLMRSLYGDRLRSMVDSYTENMIVGEVPDTLNYYGREITAGQILTQEEFASTNHNQNFLKWISETATDSFFTVYERETGTPGDGDYEWALHGMEDSSVTIQIETPDMKNYQLVINFDNSGVVTEVTGFTSIDVDVAAMFVILSNMYREEGSPLVTEWEGFSFGGEIPRGTTTGINSLNSYPSDIRSGTLDSESAMLFGDMFWGAMTSNPRVLADNAFPFYTIIREQIAPDRWAEAREGYTFYTILENGDTAPTSQPSGVAGMSLHQDGQFSFENLEEVVERTIDSLMEKHNLTSRG